MNQSTRKRKDVDLTGAPRRVAACMACSEVAEIAAFGTCYRCYRRMQRDKDRVADRRVVDRHVGARQRRENKLMSGLALAMKGCTDIGVSDPDRLRVRAILEPHLAPAKRLLGGPPLVTDTMRPFGDRDDDHTQDEEESDEDEASEQ